MEILETTEMDEDRSPLEREHSLSVVLPGGLEKNATVHGSKPVMDLLVTLCASYHLNPSDYSVEIVSPSKNNVSFKPNSPIGSLEAEKIVLKPRGGEEKIRTPYMPEATVRLLINYNKSHKTVVRVNPRLPLEELLPAVCHKCEFEVESTVLLRDADSLEALDPSKTLNEHGLREVYARDTAAEQRPGGQQNPAAPHTGFASIKVSSSSSLQDLTKKEKKRSEKKGLFSLFMKHRKKVDSSHAASAPTSPGPKSRSSSISTQDGAPCTQPPDLSKKRRAPQPPMGASNSTPNNLSSCYLPGPQKSGDETLRSTKRRAPQPPSLTNHKQGAEVDKKDSLKSLDKLKEFEEPVTHPSTSSFSSTLPPPPPPPSPPPAFPQIHKISNSNRVTAQSKDVSDARAALAKVLTASLSSGMLVKRLKNSNPKVDDEHDVEIKSVLDTNLQTKNDSDDTAGRKNSMTFKVVPSAKETSADTVVNKLNVEDAKDIEQTKEFLPAKTKQDNSDVDHLQNLIIKPILDTSVLIENKVDDPVDRKGLTCKIVPSVRESHAGLVQDTVVKELDVEDIEQVFPEKSEQGSSGVDHSQNLKDENVEIKLVNVFEGTVERKGLTTFKVVPSRRESHTEPVQDTEVKKMDVEDNEQLLPEKSEQDGSGIDHSQKLEDKENNVETKLVFDTIKNAVDTANGKGLMTFKVAPSGRESYTEPVQDEVVKETDEDVEQTEQVLPEMEQQSSGLTLSQKPENLVHYSNSPIICVVEEAATSFSKTFDDDGSKLDDKEDITNGANQNPEMCDNNHKADKNESDQCHETSEDDLYLGENDTQICPLQTSVCDDSETLDERSEQDEDGFPPPPPPVCFGDEMADADVSLLGTVKNGHVRSNSEPPQISHSPGDSSKADCGSSRFAQAVALAVNRSRLHSTGKTICTLVHQDT